MPNTGYDYMRSQFISYSYNPTYMQKLNSLQNRVMSAVAGDQVRDSVSP